MSSKSISGYAYKAIAPQGVSDEFVSVGVIEGYQVYQNKDGYLEGYKSKSFSDDTGDCDRIVSNAKDTDGFIKYVKGLRKKMTSKRYR